MAEVIQKTKLVLKDICNPKKIAADFKEGGNASILGGSLIGLVAGIHRAIRKAPDGLSDIEMVGLKGQFEGMSTDAERATIMSGICYLPQAFMEPIIAELEVYDKDEKKWVARPEWNGNPIQIAAEVYVMQATNPQGYTWALKPVGEVRTVDPLAELRKALEARKQPAIADQSDGKVKAAKK